MTKSARLHRIPHWLKNYMVVFPIPILLSLTGCVAAQYDAPSYETSQASYNVRHYPYNASAVSTFRYYGYEGHLLDQAITPFREAAPIVKVASSNYTDPTAYVPPHHTSGRFDVPTITYPPKAPSPTFNQALNNTPVKTFKTVIPQGAKAIQSAEKLLSAPIINSALSLQKSAFKAPSVRPYESARLPSVDLAVPNLTEARKQLIHTERTALIGVENKSVLAGSTSLRQSLDSAFEKSQLLAAESLRIDEAQEVLKQAKARSKPRVEFRSAVGPRASETSFAFSDTTVGASTIRRSVELDLSLPIYQGGRLRSERSAAELGIETAHASVAQTRSQIIEQTALAYLSVVRDRQLVNLYLENVDIIKQQQSSTAELLALKEVTLSEKALIDARLASQRIRLETGLGILRESEARYKNLVGNSAPQNLPVPTFNMPFTLVEVQALAQQSNPEITALITRAKSAEFDVNIAKSRNKPSLALQGVLRGAEGQSETINRNVAAEVLLNLRVPISSGGENKSRVKQAKLTRNRLHLQIRDSQDRLRDQVEQLWARKSASEKSQLFSRDQIKATQIAVQTVVEQRAEKVATIIDVLNIQQTLLDAQIQVVQDRYRQDTANVQLLNLMGVYQ